MGSRRSRVTSAIAWACSELVDNRGGVRAKSRNSPWRETMRRRRSTFAKLSGVGRATERELVASRALSVFATARWLCRGPAHRRALALREERASHRRELDARFGREAGATTTAWLIKTPLR